MLYISVPVLCGLIIVGVFLLNKYFSGGWYYGPKKNLEGQYAVITGGTSGVGKSTAIHLAKQGCNIIIGAVHIKKSEKINKELENFPNAGKIEYFELDLANLESIEMFVKKIQTQRIQYLINNAGVMGIPVRKMTSSGYETHYGINYVGHYYLTHLLWNKLNNAEYFRIINVSSVAHKKLIGLFHRPSINLDDLNFEKQNYGSHLAYSRSKFYNLLFTKILAEKIPKSKGMSMAVHPGVVRSCILQNLFPGWTIIIMKIIHPIYAIFTKDCDQGAQTTIAMVHMPASKLRSGGYYSDCQLDSEHPEITQSNWEKLWNITEKELNIKFGQINPKQQISEIITTSSSI